MNRASYISFAPVLLLFVGCASHHAGDEPLDSKRSDVVGEDSFLYLRCNSTSWNVDEKSRLKETAVDGVFGVEFDVNYQWMTTTGDDCVVTETPSVNSWGNWQKYYKTPYEPVVVPTSAELVQQPPGWAENFRVAFPSTGRFRAQVDTNTFDISFMPVSNAPVQVTAGGSHSCALLESGDVRCWGIGSSGALGYGNTDTIGDDETPASAGALSVGGPVLAIDAGAGHNCALLPSGAVRCWGLGMYGRLGYGNGNTIGDDETPASAGDVAVGGSVAQIGAGTLHTCALLESGEVRCWGYGGFGSLGYANTNNIGDNELPESAGTVDIGGNAVQISVGSYHTCALLESGAVRCWGRNESGQLGYGHTDNIGDDEIPASAGDVNVGGTVVRIASGLLHTCALLDTGAVRCWGLGDNGRLGYGNTDSIGDDETPASAGNVDVGGTVVQLAEAGQHTCALLDTGAVRCWGLGNSGRLGYGSHVDIGDDETPASAGNVDVGGNVTQIVAGTNHTCALLDTPAVRCWGYGAYGQLGYGNTNSIGDNETPASAGDVELVPSTP